MSLNGSDNLAISRAGTLYKIAGTDILAYIQANIGTSEYSVADITARNALVAGAPGNGLSVGDRVYVTSAIADGTVAAGWAIYLYMGSSTWTKVAEQESMDVVAGSITNLSYTAGAGSGIVVSSDGADATLPAADGTNAGLLLPADFTKLSRITLGSAIDLDAVKTKTGFLTVTAATDLDAIRNASHAAVTTSGTAASNPITVAGQVLSFSIANLTTAP